MPRFEMVPAPEPDRQAERQEHILKAFDRLAASYKTEDDAIWKALDSLAIKDRKDLNHWFRETKIALSRRNKKTDVVMLRDAAEHERLHGPGESEKEDEA